MNLYLTKGINGDILDEFILKENATVDDAFKMINDWKMLPENRQNFKIEEYNRYIFGEDGLYIDFGSYSTFFKLALTEAEYTEFKNNINNK